MHHHIAPDCIYAIILYVSLDTYKTGNFNVKRREENYLSFKDKWMVHLDSIAKSTANKVILESENGVKSNGFWRNKTFNAH